MDKRSLMLGATAGLSLAALYSYTTKRSKDGESGSADAEASSNANFEFARGGATVPLPSGAPRLRREDMTIAGCAFLGLNLSRNHSESPGLMSHPDSVSRQTQFDFNLIQDRDYTHFSQTDDSAWLCGGGESGESYKLKARDSAHCEIFQMATFNEAWGGCSRETIRRVMSEIMIPHMAVLPSFVLRNGDTPSELELKFELEPGVAGHPEKWANWQLRFVHNQLFEKLQCGARFCPGPHHMTFLRKAAWRDEKHMVKYFAECDRAVRQWREQGPMLLEPEQDPDAPGYPAEPLGQELTHPHGVYLFRTREEPVEYFSPNFHPPYDTPDKRKLIAKVLAREWDEDSLSWKPSGLPL